MNARFKKSGLGLLVGVVLLAMAVPAVSGEHDRPDDVPPDTPTAPPDGTNAATAEEEAAVNPESHGQSGDFDDFVSIRNQSGTGLSRLNLNTTDSLVINSDSWRLANNADAKTFEISEGGTTPRAVMRQGGNLGLGTANPLSPLHIARDGGFQLRMEGSGADYRLDAFGTSLRMGDAANTNQFRIFGADAPFNALTVGNGIGMGTSAPQGGLHVTNIGGAPTDALVVGQGIGIGTATPGVSLDIHNISGDATSNRWRIHHDGNAFDNTLRSNGVFAFNRVGTGGAEFLVRERNHPTATLDVEGHVRATSFQTASSRKFKTELEAVRPADVLAGLDRLPVSTWRFKGCEDGQGRLEQDDGTQPEPCSGQGEGPRHIGPMAEDFQKIFGLGDGQSISTVDANGILMAAVQGLSQELDAKDEAIAELEDRISRLETRLKRVEKLESRLESLEERGISDSRGAGNERGLLSRIFE